MPSRRRKQNTTTVYEERFYLSRVNRPPSIQERWVKDNTGQVVEYSLVYIDFLLYSGDNGRVLGYDNAHGFHERHFVDNRL